MSSDFKLYIYIKKTTVVFASLCQLTWLAATLAVLPFKVYEGRT